MATSTSFQSTRNAGQRHTLAQIKRAIRSLDRSRPNRYLEEFNRAFRSYSSVLTPEQLDSMVNAAGVILIGDYHSLPASQHYTSRLLEELSHSGHRPVVLGVEAIFSSDQPMVDQWWRREISEQELRRGIRFDLEWGYEWRAFYELLVTAREQADGIYGLDCEPRGDMRKIRARDRHAAKKISEIRERHPDAAIVALFGESHLAPSHLPRSLKQQLKQEQVLTILQNIDALHWQAVGEAEDIDAVRVSEEVVCVFNAAPLEKYESYRRCLERWSHADTKYELR